MLSLKMFNIDLIIQDTTTVYSPQWVPTGPSTRDGEHGREYCAVLGNEHMRCQARLSNGHSTAPLHLEQSANMGYPPFGLCYVPASNSD